MPLPRIVSRIVSHRASLRVAGGRRCDALETAPLIHAKWPYTQSPCANSPGPRPPRRRLLVPATASTAAATAPAAVRITVTDSSGQPGESAVTLTLPAGAACMLRAPELEPGAWEAGEPGPGCEALAGALGDGAGKWRLRITADRPLAVMSRLRHAATGSLANLSTGRE